MFFEAMALGRPVISTFIAGHPELVEPGVNGWLVPAGAVEPLVDAMAAALRPTHPNSRRWDVPARPAWPSGTTWPSRSRGFRT